MAKTVTNVVTIKGVVFTKSGKDVVVATQANNTCRFKVEGKSVAALAAGAKGNCDFCEKVKSDARNAAIQMGLIKG